MGNKPISIGVKLDHDAHSSGGIMAGTVYLAVSDEAPALDDRRLEVTLRGHSKIRFEGGGMEASELSNDNQNFLKVTHVLMPQVILEPGGQYEFPFQLTVPNSMPNSMNIKKKKGTLWIGYSITASLVKNSSKKMSLKQPAITARRPFYLCGVPIAMALESAHPPPDTWPAHGFHMDVGEFGCCLFRKSAVSGSVCMRARFPSTTMAPGTSFPVQISIRNESTMNDIVGLTIKVEQDISWFGGGDGVSQRILLDSCNFGGEHDESWPESTRQILSDNLKAKRREEIGLDVEHTHTWLDLPRPLQIPADVSKVANSYRNSFVAVRHYFQITFRRKNKDPNKLATTDPCVHAPICVQNDRGDNGAAAIVNAAVIGDDAPVVAHPLQELPEDWSATVIEVLPAT